MIQKNYLFSCTVITICFGVELQKVGAPKYTVYVVIGYIVYHVLMEITLKIYDLFAERQNSGIYFTYFLIFYGKLLWTFIHRETAWIDIFINFFQLIYFHPINITKNSPKKKHHVY